MFQCKKAVIALLEGLIVELEQSDEATSAYLRFNAVIDDVKDSFKEEIDRKAEPLDLFEKQLDN